MIETISRTGYAFLRYLATRLLRIDLMLLALVVTLTTIGFIALFSAGYSFPWRIEGQIRGIRGMVEKDAYCPDILTQVAAASAALNSFSKVLLANHIKTCVAQDIREGKDETIDELLTTLQKLMR